MTYRPRYFQMDDRAKLLELIADHPLATFITAGDGGPICISHVPFLARVENDCAMLEGHIARANDQWKSEATNAVASFELAGHYVSPSWYPSKKIDPRTVPTYDYVAIEARGPVRFLQDPQWLAAFVRRLTESQEPRVGGTWAVDDAPTDYLESQYKAIVGIEMRVESLIGRFKLHQNHPQENIESIIASLTQLGTAEATRLATFMSDATS